jgi:hypothetical protein
MNNGECNGKKKTAEGWKVRLISCGFASVFLALMLFSSPGLPAYAAEGGSSSFTPGAQGDFAQNYYPPGLYFRENIVYTDGKLSKYPAGAADPGLGMGNFTVNAKLDSKAWFDLLQILYSSNLNILGGRYFMNANIPVGFHVKVTANAYFPALSADIGRNDDKTTGLGDIQFVPVGIVWDIDDIHILAAQNLVLTTGRYEASKLANMGRNYFSYDEVFGVTWLDQKGGHEISFLAGYMFNTKNQATDYKTGDEFHVDYTLAQYFSKQFGVGVVGYYYQQVKDDESPVLDEINTLNSAMGLPVPGGYKSKGAAVGPAVVFSPSIGGKDINFIAKWLHEYYARNRLQGEWIWLTAIAKF